MSGAPPGPHQPVAGTTDHLWVVYHDFAGIGRAKSVPAGRIEETLEAGVSFARANWDFTITDEQVPDPGYAADSGDFRAIPDPGAIRSLPHVQGVRQAFADLEVDGSPWEGDPRGRLKRAVRALHDRGYLLQMAFESEFTVLRAGPDGTWRPVESGPMFGVDALEGQWHPWARLALDWLAAADVPVHQFAREFGAGQFELSLLPADPVEACDRFLLARQLLKAAIASSGAVATFMPKPFAERPGNGLHVHLSVLDRRGTPVLQDASDPAALSDTGRSLVAALLEHAAGQSALGSATPNSYRRLIPGSWAPAHVAWGFHNRSVLVRIPGTGTARRLEYRSGDASANVYLHALGLVASVAEGLASRREPVPAATHDLGRGASGVAGTRADLRLPTSLDAALRALEDDPLLTEAVGPVILPHYLAVKRHESNRYLAAAGPDAPSVTDWERTAYLASI